MSRRPPNPAAERAAQNQQTIKSLLKLEPNKFCADCKRNKHPRWASWNLGVFICIRCSGIHRGMGTHISRVKSVDLDSWTDEQLQSILSWGNARANKYWESKLAPGHVPSESKIENFIRTKYELKRWVMDGPKPDPGTLDADGDDDIPLSIVKEKQNIDRKESIRKSPGTSSSQPTRTATAAAAAAAPKAAAPVIDLIGTASPIPAPPSSSTSMSPPPRASTAGPAASHVAPRGAPAPPKATANTAKDSLLGLDFLGSPSTPARPSSTTGSMSGSGQSRPDLKQSILSLYATAPRTQPAAAPATQQQQQPTRAAINDPFSGLGSPTMSARNSVASASGNGGLVDAFSSLSFSSAPSSATSPKPVDAFAGLSHSRPGSTVNSSAHAKSGSSAFGSLSGGSFFNAKPAAAPAAAPARPTTTSPKPAASAFGGMSSMGGFDAFSSMSSPPMAAATSTVKAAATQSSSAFGDLFDFTAPAAPVAATTISPPPMAASSGDLNSVFNLSAQPTKAPATTSPTVPTSSLAAVSANWSNADVWGSNDGWGTSDAVAGASAATSTATATATATLGRTNDFGWGSAAPTTATSPGMGSFASQSIVPGAGGGFAPAPKVAADEEFGGWTSGSASATTAATSGNGNVKAAGFGGNDDLFSNVWG